MAGKEHLGKGLRFPVQVDAKGGLAFSAGEQSVSEALRIIIGTYPGERKKRPDFGCYIHDLVFAPNNSATAGMAAYYVREALKKWEPRIDNVNVLARPNPDRENLLSIEVQYTLKANQTKGNMVYPFYLRGEEEK